MKIGIKLQSLIPIFIYCFSAEKQAILKYHIIANIY